MISEPAAGFNDSFEKNVRTVDAKVVIESHALISSEKQDGFVTVNSSNTYAQSFTVGSSDLSVRSIDFFISRESNTDEDIDVRILADSGGTPDTGTVLGSASLFGLQNKRPRYTRCNFIPTVVLTASTKYWVEVSVNGNTSINWFKDSTKSGEDYALNTSTITTDEALCFKVLSSSSSNNEFPLPYLLSFNINLSDKFDNDVARVSLSNLNKPYAQEQPLRGMLSEDTKIIFYIGNGSDYIKKTTLLIKSSVETETSLNVDCIGLGRKLSLQKTSQKSSYAGTDYSLIVEDLLKQSGFFGRAQLMMDDGLKMDDGLIMDYGTSSYDLTGKTMPSTGTLTGTILEDIRRIEEVTDFIFYFNESGEPSFESKSTDFSPVFTFDSTNHILDKAISLNDDTKSVINRVLVDNSKTSDGNKVKLSSSTFLSNNTGSLLSSQKTKVLTITYSSEPTIYPLIENKSTETEVVELNREPSSITVEIRNKRYPDNPVSYDFDIFGSSISNDDSSLLISERARYESIFKYGVSDLVKTNDLFTSVSDISRYIAEILFFNSMPRIFFDLQTICMPTVQNRDVVKVSHDDLNDNLIYKVKSQSITFSNEKISLIATYGLEKYPFLEGEAVTIYLLTMDSGLSMDSSLNMDTSSTSYKTSYS